MNILDGSFGEGGGQIVRTALALSMLTQEPFRVKDIRSGRDKPGLKAQHVTCIRALQQLSLSKADGDFEGSSELLFIPAPITAKNITVDIGTAGSIPLLLQAVLLPCMFAQRSHTLTIIGGTDTKWSMSIDYLAQVVLPQYRRLAGIDLSLLKRGYYPKGGGKVEITIKPEAKRKEFETFEGFVKALSHKSFSLEKQGTLMSIKGLSHASLDLENAKVAERQMMSAKQKLNALKVPIDITCQYYDALSTGSGITLWAIFSHGYDIDLENPVRIGADALGEKGKSSETVGIEAAEKLMQEIQSQAPVDSHLADNMIPLLALCKPSSINVSRVTPHTVTNMYVVEKFLGKIFKHTDKKINT